MPGNGTSQRLISPLDSTATFSKLINDRKARPKLSAHCADARAAAEAMARECGDPPPRLRQGPSRSRRNPSPGAWTVYPHPL
jgi:hypothetical protein